MSRARSAAILVVSLTVSLTVSGACTPRAPNAALAPVPRAELQPVVNSAVLLDSARQLMLADSNVALGQ